MFSSLISAKTVLQHSVLKTYQMTSLLVKNSVLEGEDISVKFFAE